MNRSDRETMIVVASKTSAAKNELLKDREIKRVEQLKANAEIRRRWIQADQVQVNAESRNSS